RRPAKVTNAVNVLMLERSRHGQDILEAAGKIGILRHRRVDDFDRDLFPSLAAPGTEHSPCRPGTDLSVDARAGDRLANPVDHFRRPSRPTAAGGWTGASMSLTCR